MFRTLKNIIKKPTNVFSYGKFIIENPNATRRERQAAIKRFLDGVMPDKYIPTNINIKYKSK